MEKNCIGTDFEFQRPYMPLYIKVLLGSGAGGKNIYQVFQQSHIVASKNELKWNLNLSLECSYIPWRTVYKICFYSIEDNEYIWFQYRILHRILGVRNLLSKMNISDTDNCRLCGEHSETITHVLSEYTKSISLWENLLFWIQSSINIRIDLNKINKILGFIEQDQNFWPLNLDSIFSAVQKKSGQLNIYLLLNLIKKKIC